MIVRAFSVKCCCKRHQCCHALQEQFLRIWIPVKQQAKQKKENERIFVQLMLTQQPQGMKEYSTLDHSSKLPSDIPQGLCIQRHPFQLPQRADCRREVAQPALQLRFSKQQLHSKRCELECRC